MKQKVRKIRIPRTAAVLCCYAAAGLWLSRGEAGRTAGCLWLAAAIVLTIHVLRQGRGTQKDTNRADRDAEESSNGGKDNG